MKRIIFFMFASLGKLIKKLKRIYYQFYNLQYLRWKGAKVGSHCLMEGKMVLTINSDSRLEIGENFICRSGFGGHILGEDVSGIHIYSGGVFIGDNSGMSATNINCVKSVRIGSHVLIGAGCLITDTNHHSLDWRIRCLEGDTDKKSAPVVIEDYVFVGAKCIILKGVTIGEKSIIAAGSVVVSDIPANCIAGGNPCKVIKYIM